MLARHPGPSGERRQKSDDRTALRRAGSALGSGSSGRLRGARLTGGKRNTSAARAAGTGSTPQLENEGGTVVWDVEVTGSDGTTWGLMAGADAGAVLLRE